MYDLVELIHAILQREALLVQPLTQVYHVVHLEVRVAFRLQEYNTNMHARMHRGKYCKTHAHKNSMHILTSLYTEKHTIHT